MAIQEHELAVAVNPFDDRFAAMCSCGWEGDEQETREWATEEWEAHCEAVFMKATGF